MSAFSVLSLDILFFIHVGFALSLCLKRNDLADIFWGLGFILVAITMFVHYGAGTFTKAPRAWLALLVVGLWAGRLSLHVAFRNLGHAEDWRYKKWRQEWGKWFVIRSYLQVWVLQALILAVISIVVVLEMKNQNAPLVGLDLIGFLISIFGFSFETIADAQLKNFKKDPAHRGQIITTGLWRNSRHPNYFGEVLVWWGLALTTVHLHQGFYGLISAFMITFMIIKVSGVAMLEKGMEGRPGFAEYKRKTSAFIPLPRKSRAS